MRRIGIIAAGGESKRTGLSAYTTKAALPLNGKPLLAHQLDFLRRVGCTCAFVIARPEHARLLGRLLESRDRAFTAFVLSDCATGWAGEVERAIEFIHPDDGVVLISCDNDHRAAAEQLQGPLPFVAAFTYTTWEDATRPPTDGPVLAAVDSAWGAPNRVVWSERSSAGFTGRFFSGYAVVNGWLLRSTLRSLPTIDGKKEFTALLALLAQHPRFVALPYPGPRYEDIRDLRALALLDAGLSSWDTAHVDLGAGVLLHDAAGRALLTERQDGRGWTIPGGILEPGESYAHAAIREAREEIGVRLDIGDLRLLGVYPALGKGGPACSVIFHAPSPGTRLTTDPLEVRAVRWFDTADAPREMPFGLRAAVHDWFIGRELDVHAPAMR